jgi:DNA-directed RNA polymerase specialized sigma24 family protein
MLENLFKDASLIGMARKITGGDEIYKDLLQETFLILNSLPKEKIEKLNEEGQLANYAVVVMFREYKNPYNNFNKVHKHLERDAWSPPSNNDSSLKLRDLDRIVCLEYFNSVTPERVKIARELERMRVEDISKNKYPYRSELVKVYLKYGSARNVQREVNINYSTVAKDVKKIIEEIKKRI